MPDTKNTAWIPIYVMCVVSVFLAILMIPSSRKIFGELTGSHPYLLGFIKFGLLALAGEFLSMRIREGKWRTQDAVVIKFLIWGMLGVWISLMMKVFSAGVDELMQKGLLIGSSRLVRSFTTSVLMNVSFAPVFMIVHKLTDTWLDMKQKRKEAKLATIVGVINWEGFLRRTLFKTILFFWIPAHTVTFLLPQEFQIITAAFLSLALGVMLSWRGQEMND